MIFQGETLSLLESNVSSTISWKEKVAIFVLLHKCQHDSAEYLKQNSILGIIVVRTGKGFDIR